MMVNNEIGVVQPVWEIADLCRSKGIIFHCDAVQGAGRLEIDVQKFKVDLLTITAHKIYGPKGIGALYVRRKPRVRIEAQIHGGGHERGFRSGTLATHQIVGFGEAARLAKAEMASENERVRSAARPAAERHPGHRGGLRQRRPRPAHPAQPQRRRSTSSRASR